jgi:hypothetical protein
MPLSAYCDHGAGSLFEPGHHPLDVVFYRKSRFQPHVVNRPAKYTQRRRWQRKHALLACRTVRNVQRHISGVGKGNTSFQEPR